MKAFKNGCLLLVMVFGALFAFYGSVGALFVLEPNHLEFSELLISIAIMGLASALIALKFFLRLNAYNPTSHGTRQ